MANFMGPMAPPQAAPTQPPQLDIRTNPNQRERFRNFMRQNTRPNLAVPAMQQPMMPQAPMPMAPQAPRPPIPMAIRPNAPMPPQPAPMPYGANINVFSPQYMNQPRPMYLEDGGDVPMPTAVPNSKQKDVMLRIAYDEALRKGAVENALRQLETDRVIERSKKMELDRIRDIELQDRLDDVKRMRLEAELADRNYRLKGLLTPPDQGLEDDPLFALPIKKEDGGAVPPRRTDIRGQDHMLAYITPDEAGILEALGGSGEAGPMGIPAYRSGPGDMGAGSDSGSDSSGDGNGNGNGDGNGSGSSSDGPSGGDYDADTGIDAETDDPDTAGAGSREAGYGEGRDGIAGTADDVMGTPGSDLGGYQGSSGIAAARERALAEEQQRARDLVAKTFVTSNNKKSLVGAPNSKLGYVTTGKPSESQIADALAAAKSLGMDISNVDPSMASDLGLNDPETTAVEAVSAPTTQGKKSEVDLLLDIFSMPTTPQTTPTSQFTSPTSTNPAQQAVNDMVTAAANASTRSFAPAASVPGPVATGTSSTPATDFFADTYSDLVESYTGKPDTARGTTARGIMDVFSDLSLIGVGSNLLGLDNQFTQPRASAKDRAAFNIGELLSLDERAYDINDAVKSGMFDPETGHVTGIQPPGLTKGYLSTNPFGAVVYSGMPDPNYTGPYANLVNPNYGGRNEGGDGPVFIPPVVQPPTVTDPRPEDNMLGGMDTLPGNIDVTGVPSTRVPYEGELRLPVGYGDPRTGYISPEAYRTTGFMPPVRALPIGFFEDGGAVLDQAAGRFLEALTAA